MYASYHGSVLPNEANLRKCLSINVGKRNPQAINAEMPTKTVPKDCPGATAIFSAGYTAGLQAAMKARQT